MSHFSSILPGSGILYIYFGRRAHKRFPAQQGGRHRKVEEKNPFDCYFIHDNGRYEHSSG
nr:hypothetical protein [uncultured Acetatifactor sp.]